MKFRTIWTMQGMLLGECFRRTGELITMSLAARLPKRIAYWSFIQQGGKYIKSDEVVPDVKFLELVSRMEKN